MASGKASLQLRVFLEKISPNTEVMSPSVLQGGLGGKYVIRYGMSCITKLAHEC